MVGGSRSEHPRHPWNDQSAVARILKIGGRIGGFTNRPSRDAALALLPADVGARCRPWRNRATGEYGFDVLPPGARACADVG